MTVGYALVQYRGEFYSDGKPKLITLRIKQFMAKLEEALGYGVETLDLEQGCHHAGINSGGTHDGADVFDLSYDNWENKAKAAIPLGAIPFVRPFNWDGKSGDPHIHVLLRGSLHFSSQAAAQIPDWDKHLDGLYYHRPYDPNLPWGTVRDFVYEPKWQRGSGQAQQGPTFPALQPIAWALFHAKGDLAAWVNDHPNASGVAEVSDLVQQAWQKLHALEDGGN